MIPDEARTVSNVGKRCTSYRCSESLDPCSEGYHGCPVRYNHRHEDEPEPDAPVAVDDLLVSVYEKFSKAGMSEAVMARLLGQICESVLDDRTL